MLGPNWNTGKHLKNNEEEAQHLKFITEHRKKQQLSDRGLKLIATDYTLDHWLAQNYHLNLRKLPKVNYTACNKKLFEGFQKKYSNGIGYQPGETINKMVRDMPAQATSPNDYQLQQPWVYPITT